MSNGYWWCPSCQEMVDGVNVTYQEFHDSCGHIVEWMELIESPIERISELESLSRKLVEIIDDLRRQLDECGLDGEMWEIYRKAKEVLGDEKA